MNKDRRLKVIIFALLIILIGVLVIKISPILLQNDTLYDIKLGERYVTTGMFKIDDYSIHEGLIYQTHHYLVCIIDYFVYHLFSFKGIYLLEVIILGVIAGLFHLINKTILRNKFVIFMVLIFQLFALSPFVSVRAQMYSYIIFLLEILVIEKYLNTNKRKYVVFIAILPLILINFHSGVIYFYFIILGTYLLNALKINFWRIESDKRIGKKQVKNIIIAALVGMCLTVINPYGIDGVTYGLKTLESYYITHHISEFKPFSIDGALGHLITGYVFVCAFCLLFSKRKIKLHELLLLLGTTIMTLMSIRHFSLLIVTSVVLTPHFEALYRSIDNGDWSLFKSLKNGITYMNVILVLFYIFTFSYLSYDIIGRPKTPLPSKFYPIEATKYIKSNIDPKARIFNQYVWGSYLMFYDIPVFVDSRCDLYNEEYNKGVTVFKDYIDVIYNDVSYEDIVSKYNLDYFLLDRSYSLVNRILQNPDNKVIYKDKVAILIKVHK